MFSGPATIRPYPAAHVRIDLDGGRTIHFRASGNAPELRCYAEAKSAQDAEDLVRWGLKAAASAMADEDGRA
jgi:phosphomannomutase